MSNGGDRPIFGCLKSVHGWHGFTDRLMSETEDLVTWECQHNSDTNPVDVCVVKERGEMSIRVGDRRFTAPEYESAAELAWWASALVRMYVPEIHRKERANV